MRKEEYVSAIIERLDDYPFEVKRNVVALLERQFVEKQKEGLDEDAIMKQLGSVDDVVATIEEQIAAGKFNIKEDKTDIDFQSVEKNMEEIGTAVTGVMKELFKATKVLTKNVSENLQTREPETQEGVFEDWQSCNQLEILTAGIPVDVHIISGNELIYRYQAKKNLLSAAKPLLQVEKKDGVARILTGVRDGNYLGSGTLELIVPSTIHTIRIDNQSGDIRITNLAVANLDIKADKGDVDLLHMAVSEASIKGTSGDVKIDDIAGNLNIQVTLGDVTIHAYQEGIIRCETKRGDIKIRSLDAKPRIITSSQTGDITCQLTNTNYTAEIKTRSGSFKPNISSTVYKVEKGRWIAGEGEGIIQLVSVAGDISLE